MNKNLITVYAPEKLKNDFDEILEKNCQNRSKVVQKMIKEWVRTEILKQAQA